MNSGTTDLPVFKLLAGEGPLIIGHRGYCAVAPENTLPSFKLALEAKADLVELDYQHSKDGVPLVIHDDTLDRTTDARRRWKRRRIRVADRTAAEIQDLDAGSWFDAKFAGARVPLLTEALELICAGGNVALIEQKSGDAATLVRLLRERELINRVVLISFDWEFLRRFNKLEPGQVLGALGPPARLADGRKPARLSRQPVTRRLDELDATGASLVVWNRRISNAEIRAAGQHRLKVWVYTINSAGPARRVLEAGAQGIITNKVVAIQAALARK